VRRRLLVSTFAIALVCVGILGVPLALLARHEVWASANDRLQEAASTVGTSLEDRLDSGRPLDLSRFVRLMPNRRIVVRRPHRPVEQSGPPFHHPLTATVTISGASVSVEASRAPTMTRAREVTLLVIGLAVAAVVTAVALALWQARRLALPLAELATRADALGRGEFAAAPLQSGVPEIDQVSAELERSAHQLGTLIDLQQQFASDAAHQLRTPLTSIGLHLDEIGHIGDPTVRAEADDALAQVERLNGVISSLLARARGNSADAEDLDLATLLTEGTTPWRRVLSQQQRTLEVRVCSPLPVRARREHVLGVLTSLLDNAVVHGTGTVQLTVAAQAGMAVVTVRDAGAGVRESLRDSIFDRQTSGGSGTGIGLALARSLAAAESGALTLSPDDPAEFVFTLPLTATDATTPDG
jgi:signal transduction histidine kinase